MADAIDLGWMRTFLAAFRLGSLSGAARELGLAQSTVTVQIAALEASLGYELFDRRPTGVVPNARAAALAARVARPLDEVEQALWDARPDSDRRTVHLAGPAEFLTARVLPRLDAVVGREVQLRVVFGLGDQLLTELAAGLHDLVVSVVRPRNPALAATALMDEEFALVSAPGGPAPAAGRDPADPSAWRDVPVVAYAEHLPIIRRFWLTVFDRRPAEIHAWVTVPDLRVVADLVVRGLGVSVLPTYLIDDALTDGRLVRLVDPPVPPLNTLFLAVRRGAPERDPVLAAVGDALRRFSAAAGG